jgi:hypothetical protein
MHAWMDQRRWEKVGYGFDITGIIKIDHYHCSLKVCPIAIFEQDLGEFLDISK